MELRPRLDEPSLAPRKLAVNALDWVNSDDCHVRLIVRMKMRPMMQAASLGVHPNDDPEEAAELWHPATVVSAAEDRDTVQVFAELNHCTSGVYLTGACGAAARFGSGYANPGHCLSPVLISAAFRCHRGPLVLGAGMPVQVVLESRTLYCSVP